MTTLTFQFSNNSGGLFTTGDTTCEECPRYAVGLFAPVDDEGLFALCYEHMLAISPLAASILLGRPLGGDEESEYTDLQLMLIDELGMCPACGSGLDTGAGFGMRDLECGDFCTGPAWQSEDETQDFEACSCGGEDEDAHCGWKGSYPLDLYRDKLMRKHMASGDPSRQILANVVEKIHLG